MRLSSLVISVLLIGLIIVGFYSLINTLANESAYDVNVDDQYETAFDKTINISEQMSDDYEKIVGNSDENETGWVVDVTSYLGLVPNAVSLAKNTIKLPITVVGEIIESLTNYLYLPEWMEAFITAMLFVFVIFALIALILRYRYT